MMKTTLAALALVISSAAMTQESGSQFVDQVTLQDDEGCYQLELAFNVLVAYQHHFPLRQGKDLYIRLQPVPAPNRDERLIRGRKAIALPHEVNTPLLSLVYEGDADEGPTLVLHYSEAQQFSVLQGEDFRRLSIRFGLPMDHCISAATMESK